MSAIGRIYRYVSRTGRVPWRPGEALRYGSLVRVLAWHRGKALVRFLGDGYRAVTCGRCLRKVREEA